MAPTIVFRIALFYINAPCEAWGISNLQIVIDETYARLTEMGITTSQATATAQCFTGTNRYTVIRVVCLDTTTRDFVESKVVSGEVHIVVNGKSFAALLGTPETTTTATAQPETTVAPPHNSGADSIKKLLGWFGSRTWAMAAAIGIGCVGGFLIYLVAFRRGKECCVPTTSKDRPPSTVSNDDDITNWQPRIAGSDKDDIVLQRVGMTSPAGSVTDLSSRVYESYESAQRASRILYGPARDNDDANRRIQQEPNDYRVVQQHPNDCRVARRQSADYRRIQQQRNNPSFTAGSAISNGISGLPPTPPPPITAAWAVTKPADMDPLVDGEHNWRSNWAKFSGLDRDVARPMRTRQSLDQPVLPSSWATPVSTAGHQARRSEIHRLQSENQV
jgi:hypothetical protein